MAALRYEHQEDVSKGYLFSHQIIHTQGPPLPESAWKSLPDFMERLHFRKVAFGSLGMLRAAPVQNGLDVRLLGRWVALSFRETKTQQDECRILRQWTITGGFLSRGREKSYGTLALGAEKETVTEAGISWKVWGQVEGYPSRFLVAKSSGIGYGIRSFVGKIYAAYHKIVTFRYLRALASALQRGDF